MQGTTASISVIRSMAMLSRTWPLAAVLLAPFAHSAPLDPETLRLYGGTYAAKCGDARFEHLQILADSLVIVRGDRQVVAKDIESSISFLGDEPPADFQIALSAEVKPDFGVVFLVYRDQRGEYLVLDGSPKMLQALGHRQGDATRHYKCMQVARKS
jgi:hypothetical protein